MKISDILTAVYNIIGTIAPVLRPIFLAASLVMAFNTYMNAVWTHLFTLIDSLVIDTSGTADFSGLALVNYCFPIDTMLTFMVSYAGVRLACAGFRIIKSFIPTVA